MLSAQKQGVLGGKHICLLLFQGQRLRIYSKYTCLRVTHTKNLKSWEKLKSTRNNEYVEWEEKRARMGPREFKSLKEEFGEVPVGIQSRFTW